jgi:hypothetical protein
MYEVGQVLWRVTLFASASRVVRTFERGVRASAACLERHSRRWRLHAYYHEVVALQKAHNLPDMQVAFVKWPANYDEKNRLCTLLERFDTVIYCGKNDQHTACATPAFWEAMRWRPILCKVEHPTNDVIVYGPTYLEPEWRNRQTQGT